MSSGSHLVNLGNDFDNTAYPYVCYFSFAQSPNPNHSWSRNFNITGQTSAAPQIWSEGGNAAPVGGLGSSSTSASSTVSTSASSTAKQSSTPTATPASPADSSSTSTSRSGVSVGALVGIVVAIVGCFAILFIGMAVFLVMRRRRIRRLDQQPQAQPGQETNDEKDMTSKPSEMGGDCIMPVETDGVQRFEKEGEGRQTPEVAGDTSMIRELEGNITETLQAASWASSGAASRASSREGPA